MRREDLDALRQFFGGYFHQDWVVDTETADEVIEQYVADTPDLTKRVWLARRIVEYIDGRESTLAHDLLHDLGCHYDPTADGFEPIPWLYHVADRVRAGQARTVRELGGEIWSELRRMPEVGFPLDGRVTDLVMGVLARHAGKIIENDLDLSVAPRPRLIHGFKVMADYECSPIWDLGPSGPGNVDPEDLSLSRALAWDLRAWAARYDGTLRRDDPRASGFSSEAAHEEFVDDGRRLAERLAVELGTYVEVVYFNDRTQETESVSPEAEKDRGRRHPA